MAKHLPVPPELKNLIEKRENAEQRATQRRKQQEEQRSLDLGPAGAAESADELEDIPEDERRSSIRRTGNRRQSNRRHEDQT